MKAQEIYLLNLELEIKKVALAHLRDKKGDSIMIVKVMVQLK